MTNAIEASRKRLIRVLAVAFVTVLVYLVADEFGLLRPEVYERMASNAHVETDLSYWLKQMGKVLLFAAIPAIVAAWRPRR